MGKNRQITHMEKFQTIHVATAPVYGLANSRFSGTNYCGKEGKGKKTTFTVEKT